MNLYLEVLNSPDVRLIGAKIKLYDGLTLGRKGADFQIKDKKLSSLHAQIQQGEDGRLVLVDQDSANGILINEHQVKQVVLFSNVIFTLGKTEFKVFEAVGDAHVDGLRFINWSDELRGKLRTFLEQYQEKMSEYTEGSPMAPKPRGPYQMDIAPFFEALKLSFIAGLQTDEELFLGYGPRRAGFHHFDISLLEPACPDELFELRPTSDGILLICFDSEFMTLNGNAVTKVTLSDGDTLAFGRSKIRISMIGGT